MKKFSLFHILIISLMLSSCTSQEITPDTIVKRCTNALESKDYLSASSYMDSKLDLSKASIASLDYKIGRAHV